MASSKELQTASRPLAHRMSLSSTSISAPTAARQPHSRSGSHTLNPLTATNRVQRRKSVSNNGANVMAAAAAAVAGLADVTNKVNSLPIAIGARRQSKSGGFRPDMVGPNGVPSPPASMPAGKFLDMEGKPEVSESAVEDQENEEAGSEDKVRIRRASDGQPLAKEGRKFNRPEIRCEQCGKPYKHSSCLAKHLWEHSPAWSVTSKLLISKHQQVQLLEAASVLVGMNNDQPTSPPDSARETSPSPSGAFSEQVDGHSSANTTPPPQMDMGIDDVKYAYSPPMSDDDDDMRGGIARSLYPRQSTASVFGDFEPHREHSTPPPAGYSTSMEADASGLAKGVAMLSCSYRSTGESLTSHADWNIPPVPQVPALFLDKSLGTPPFLASTSPFLHSYQQSFPSRAPESFTRGEGRGMVLDGARRNSDVMMEDADDDARSRARSDEEDFGVFGQMEE